MGKEKEFQGNSKQSDVIGNNCPWYCWCTVGLGEGEEKGREAAKK